jgi:hypothetical protein
MPTGNSRVERYAAIRASTVVLLIFALAEYAFAKAGLLGSINQRYAVIVFVVLLGIVIARAIRIELRVRRPRPTRR